MPISPSRSSAPATGRWVPLAWSPAEADNFGFFRDRSNEASVLAAAIGACVRTLRLDPASAAAIDVGSSDGEFGQQLDGLFATYRPVAFLGDHDVAQFVADLDARDKDELLRFDVCILAHVLPYISDPGHVLLPLARHANGHGIGVAVLLAPDGDQYRVGQLARNYDAHARLHDHVAQFAAWLAARNVAFQTHTVVSETAAEDPAALLRLLAFFTGSSDERLLERIAKDLNPAPGGGYRLTSEHRLVTWRMRDLLPRRIVTDSHDNATHHRRSEYPASAAGWSNRNGKGTATTLVGFDLNKTLIRENSWYDLNIAMGISPAEDERLYRLGPEGEGIFTYEEWIDILVRLMRRRGRATRSAMERVLLGFDYLEGAKDVVANLKERGCVVGVISGAMSLIVERVVQDLNLDFGYSNAELMFDQADALQDIHLQGADLQFKVDAIRRLQGTYGAAADIYYVADGDNDEAVFHITNGIMIEIASSGHESWKRRALEEGTQLSLSAARASAWKVVSRLTDVPNLILP